jgi:hypothetical protein
VRKEKMINKKYKWITIKEEGFSASGKTKIFSVVNNEHTDYWIGLIKWNSGYRKYAFYPSTESYYEEDCLKDIAEFLEKLKGKKCEHQFGIWDDAKEDWVCRLCSISRREHLGLTDVSKSKEELKGGEKEDGSVWK